jgi:hypothetical protein
MNQSVFYEIILRIKYKNFLYCSEIIAILIPIDYRTMFGRGKLFPFILLSITLLLTAKSLQVIESVYIVMPLLLDSFISCLFDLLVVFNSYISFLCLLIMKLIYYLFLHKFLSLFSVAFILIPSNCEIFLISLCLNL